MARTRRSKTPGKSKAEAGGEDSQEDAGSKAGVVGSEPDGEDAARRIAELEAEATDYGRQVAALRQEASDLTKRLSTANDQIAALTPKDVRAAMVKAQDETTGFVEMDTISVEFPKSAHVPESEMYRLCQEVRGIMISRGLYVRGDFTIRSKRPR